MKTLLESVVEQIENLSTSELIQLNNSYCSANGYEDEIHENTDEFLDSNFSSASNLMKTLRYSDYDYNHKYVKFNGNGNLESFSDIEATDLVDTVEVLAEYAIDNQREFSMLDFTEEEEEE